MKANNSISPYIVNRFKVLELSSTDTSIDLIYISKLIGDEHDTIEKFLDKKVTYKKQISENQFWKLASTTYPDITFTTDSTTDDISVSHQIEAPKSYYDEPTDLTSIPLQDLVKEIRRRQINMDAEANITITPDNKASFEFTKLAWPTGSFKVTMKIIEEIVSDMEKTVNE